MRSKTQTNGPTFTEQARREQITRGAILVLAENGYSATSLAAIATRLGMSKGVISYHFDGKAELLRAVVSHVLASAAAWMTPQVLRAATHRAALRAYIAANLSFLQRHPEDIAALTEVLVNARATEGVPALYDRAHEEAVAGLEQLFAGGIRSGEFWSALPARVAAVSLRASIDAVSTSLRDDPAFDVAEFERGLVALFEHAVVAPATASEVSDEH